MVTLDLWNQAVSDSFQISAPTNLPASIQLHVQWIPGQKVNSFSDPSQGYAGIYLPAQVQVDWSAAGPTSATDMTAFSFHSSADGQTSAGAIGHEVVGSPGKA